MGRKLVLTVCYVLCLSIIIVEVGGHNPGYVINVTCGRAPVVDGAILYEEWSGASTVSFNNTLVYLKHDGSSLYMGFNVSDATLDLDREGVLAYIDVNHDGGSETQADDVGFGVFRNGTSFELRYPNAYPPTGGWTVCVQEETGFYTAEFNITYAKIGLAPDVNKTLGLLLNSYDYSTLQNCFWPPLTQSEAVIPSNWGDLTSDDRWKPFMGLTGTVYIRADGSIDPPDAPITTLDNITYTLTGNITSEADGIVIERNNIILDGAGYTVQETGVYVSKGIRLNGTNNVIIKNMRIEAYDYGIWLEDSLNNSLIENNIKNNDYGIYLSGSSNNTIVGNNIANNGYGVALFGSSNYNSISGNNIRNSTGTGIVFSLAIVQGELYFSSNNSICENNITANNHGIQLFESSNNIICENNITENSGDGIYLEGSSNNIIRGNNITNNGNEGITLTYATINSIFYSSINNSITENSITENTWIGIVLTNSSNNVISRNNITNNWSGIGIYWSLDNTIYHNNFIDNTRQVYIYTTGYANVWDDGYPSGGNYWSDYNGTDLFGGSYQNETGSDGVGDAPHVIDVNNRDNCPLIGPFSRFEAEHWNGVTYNFDAVTNSTILNFELFESLIPEIPSTISLNVSGPDNTMGFCRITIPNIIVQDLWQDNYTVLLNGEPWPFRNWTDTQNTYIYINYTHSTHEITIIPEFPSTLTLAFFATTTLIATSLWKSKRKRQSP